MCGWCSVHWPTLGWEPGAAPEAVKVSDKRLALTSPAYSPHRHHQHHTYRWRALAGALPRPLVTLVSLLVSLLVSWLDHVEAPARNLPPLHCVCRKVSATPAVTLAASFNTHFQFQQTCWGQGRGEGRAVLSFCVHCTISRSNILMY